MKANKLSVSLDPELGDEVREAARKVGKPASTWVAEACAVKLRADALAEVLREWEAEDGPFTPEELARAEQRLGRGLEPPTE